MPQNADAKLHHIFQIHKFFEHFIIKHYDRVN